MKKAQHPLIAELSLGDTEDNTIVNPAKVFNPSLTTIPKKQQKSKEIQAPQHRNTLINNEFYFGNYDFQFCSAIIYNYLHFHFTNKVKWQHVHPSN